MIINTLKKVLFRHNITITQLHKLTGISRTTLTSMYYNKGDGIQYETLDKISLVLDINVNDLLKSIPLDIKLLDVAESKAYINVGYKGEYEDCVINLNMTNLGNDMLISHTSYECSEGLKVLLDKYFDIEFKAVLDRLIINKLKGDN